MKRFIGWFLSLALMGTGCGEPQTASWVALRVGDSQGSPAQETDLLVQVDQDSPLVVTLTDDLILARFVSIPDGGRAPFDPEIPGSAFEISDCRVHWRRIDGGPNSGPGWNLSDFDFETSISVTLPWGILVETSVVLIPPRMREARHFFDRVTNGSIRLIAEITFIGHPLAAPESEYAVSVSIEVRVAGIPPESESHLHTFTTFFIVR